MSYRRYRFVPLSRRLSRRSDWSRATPASHRRHRHSSPSPAARITGGFAMEVRQVEYFLAVVEHRGINGAATALGVTQPTVSQAIREFERGLGAELFHRLGRGMVLSAAGRSIVGPARQILRDITSVPYVVSSTPDRQLR